MKAKGRVKVREEELQINVKWSKEREKSKYRGQYYHPLN